MELQIYVHGNVPRISGPSGKREPQLHIQLRLLQYLQIHRLSGAETIKCSLRPNHTNGLLLIMRGFWTSLY